MAEAAEAARRPLVNHREKQARALKLETQEPAAQLAEEKKAAEEVEAAAAARAAGLEATSTRGRRAGALGANATRRPEPICPWRLEWRCAPVR